MTLDTILDTITTIIEWFLGLLNSMTTTTGVGGIVGIGFVVMILLPVVIGSIRGVMGFFKGRGK